MDHLPTENRCECAPAQAGDVYKASDDTKMADMDLDEIDIAELRRCMLLALDFIVAHQVARDHAYDLARITAARDALEQRVLLALTETDVTEMPDGWSWRHAAHEISIRVALAITEEEKVERVAK